MNRRVAVLGLVAGAALVGSATIPAAAAPVSSATITGGSGTLSDTNAPTARNVSLNASVSYAITNAQCTSTSILFTAKTQENGFSGVQQFKQTAVEQEFTGAGWVNITAKAVTKSVKFPNDGRNFSYTFGWRANHAANGASHRVVWQGFYLNSRGGTLYKTVPVKINCL